VLHRFLHPPHSSLLRLTPRRLSWKRRSHLTLSFALCVLRLCFAVVFLCCIVSYALRITRCSLLHHVTCLGKDALICYSHLPFEYFVCAPMLFSCVASFPTPSAFLVAPTYTTSPVLAWKRRSHLTALCASICCWVASFPTASTLLVAPSYTTSTGLLGKVLDPSFEEEERRLFLLRKVVDPSRLCRELHKKEAKQVSNSKLCSSPPSLVTTQCTTNQLRG
jgi:hypothetical protein